jgi:hypothetical protein
VEVEGAVDEEEVVGSKFDELSLDSVTGRYRRRNI